MALILRLLFRRSARLATAQRSIPLFPMPFLEANSRVVTNLGRFALMMEQHGLLRPLGPTELSDGTLRYLLWIAALFTARPPALMVLNEPETSLHADLLPPLARLITQASERSQVIVVTHASRLISALTETAGCHCVTLEKTFGETSIVGAQDLSLPAWHWPSR